MHIQVPVNNRNEMLLSTIDPFDSRGDLIRAASVVIWDEAPMVNRAVVACVDDICQKVMQNSQPFGGKIIILLGDFRQTCPVVRGGSQADIIDASIKSSPLWPLFQLFPLSMPIRNADDPEFASWVDNIGDGASPEINLDFISRACSHDELLDFVYPSEVLADPSCCLRRAILCPTNMQVNMYNESIVCRIDGVHRTYLAADSLQEADEVGLIPPQHVLDYVAAHTPPGLPHHTLNIKVNAVYCLMRNFSIDAGLVKNTRVIVTGIGTRLVTVRILRGIGGGCFIDAEDILLPRINFTHTLHSGHTLLRRQFPLSAAYATTFNSCQGLTLDRVGVDLTTPVFSHGQLYTALSRIRHRDHARVLLDADSHSTINVTYHELLL